MTRIRYTFIGTELISKPIFINGTISIQISINTKTLVVTLNSTNGRKLQFKSTSLQSAKRLARKHLINLGAYLGEEIRNRPLLKRY